MGEFPSVHKEIQRLESKLFLKSRSYVKHTLHQGQSSVDYWLPKAERGNSGNYGARLNAALERVNALFPLQVKPSIEVFYATNTDDYNAYKRIWSKDARKFTHKHRGDWEKGSSVSDKIVMFTYKALVEETTILKDHNGHREEVDEHYNALHLHEMSHAVVNSLGLKIPNWFNEGIALMVGAYGNRSGAYGRENLKTHLIQMDGTPEIGLRAVGGSLIHQFSFHFMNHLMKEHTGPITAGEDTENGIYSIPRLQKISEMLHAMQNGLAFEQAFEGVFGVSVRKAFNNFKRIETSA
jgi:hypothetical protein